MAPLVVKVALEMPDLSVETRRFDVEQDNINVSGIFSLVQSKIGNLFPALKDMRFYLFWKDLDDDFITMSTDEEMHDALKNGLNGICKIFVKVAEDELIETTEGAQDSVEDQSANVKGNHEMGDPWQSCPPPCPPPAGPFHHARPPPHPFAFHGPPALRPFGGPWGWRGRGKHCHGPYGHHQMHHGHDRGHHWHSHYSHGHGHGHWGKHHGHDNKHEWKEALRNSVPMPHRRWAKVFIQSWRRENLKNGTTTTSDSDCNSDGKMTMANAGVPQAYAEWLRMKLVCWHMKWSTDEKEEIDGEGTRRKDEKKKKKALKASVPIEFRKWIKWYLNTHCGKRGPPKFKGCQQDCQKWGADHWKKEKFMKKQFLKSQVPKEYRVWTKEFIQTWRIEKKLEEPNSAMPVSSNTESCDSEMDVGAKATTFPEAYKQWLEIFLPRWHIRRGLLERSPSQSMTGGIDQFQTTVPMEFREWVKHYLCMHYIKKKNSQCFAASEPATVNGKYQKILQTFQKKWLQNQQFMDEESDILIILSSSDDEFSPDKGDTEMGEPEKSFGNLSLNKDDAQKRKVHFDSNQCTPMNSEFRQWAKQALMKWDGKTVTDVDDKQNGQVDEEEVFIPPHMNRWMTKFMMKMQKKKMKQQFKAAKRDMKAAVKQQKHGMN